MNEYRIGTKCVQGGYTPGNGEPRQIPIVQSTTFKYATSEDMGKLFDLEASGYFYSRLQNPTNDMVAAKIAEMEATKAYVTKVIQYVQEEKKDKDIRPVREVKTYLEENYHQEISLNDLADIVSLNASYLSALFKKETGMTYTEYVMFCRLEKAKELLADTGKSIAEIADAVGYHDTRHFSKLFTRNIGLKPSEYRKLYS